MDYIVMDNTLITHVWHRCMICMWVDTLLRWVPNSMAASLCCCSSPAPAWHFALKTQNSGRAGEKKHLYIIDCLSFCPRSFTKRTKPRAKNELHHLLAPLRETWRSWCGARFFSERVHFLQKHAFLLFQRPQGNHDGIPKGLAQY